jgi:F0F1-type ATP synthase membrane subunit b/b'
VLRNWSRSRAVAALCLLGLAAGDAAAAEGLELFPNPRILLALLVAFALLVPIVNRALLAPMLRVLDARAERTGGARRRAAHLEESAREAMARYEHSVLETRRAAESARRTALEEARRLAAEETGAARADAELELGRARAAVAASLAEARRGLRAQSTALAREAAARVLGRELA